MLQEQREAFEAVDRINDELYERFERNKTSDRENIKALLSVTLSSVFTSISLHLQLDSVYIREIVLYNSEDNDRIFFEETNEYESFYTYIKRKIKEFKKELNTIKF